MDKQWKTFPLCMGRFFEYACQGPSKRLSDFFVCKLYKATKHQTFAGCGAMKSFRKNVSMKGLEAQTVPLTRASETSMADIADLQDAHRSSSHISKLSAGVPSKQAYKKTVAL